MAPTLPRACQLLKSLDNPFQRQECFPKLVFNHRGGWAGKTQADAKIYLLLIDFGYRAPPQETWDLSKLSWGADGSDCSLWIHPGACGDHAGHECGLAQTEKCQPPGPPCAATQLLVHR